MRPAENTVMGVMHKLPGEDRCINLVMRGRCVVNYLAGRFHGPNLYVQRISQ